MRKICYTQYINYKKQGPQGDTVVEWWRGSAYTVVDGSVTKQHFSFSSCRMYEHNGKWIHLYYEFIYFLQCKINEFIYFCSAKWMNSFNCNTWIHLIAVSAYRKPQGQSPSCEHIAQTARAKPEPRVHSASREGKARAHLLPQPGRARLPQPLGLHAAALIVRVACGSPNS